MIPLVAGVAMLVISFILNIVGGISEPVGDMIAIPNVSGGFYYIPQEGYDHPYQSLVLPGKVFLFTGFIPLAIGILMARQRVMAPRTTGGRSPYLIGSDAWRVYTMMESHNLSDREELSREYTSIEEPNILVSSCVGYYSEVPAGTPSKGLPSIPAESKVARPLIRQPDLELHLHQLRFSRDNGLLTQQEYEDKKKELMKEFRVSAVALDGPLSFKY